MKKESKITRVLLLIVVVAICAVLYFKIFGKEIGTKVVSWDNIYNENNLNFFYEDIKESNINSNLKALDDTYSVKKIVSGESTEMKKVLKTVEILNTVVKYDDVKDTLYYNGYDILKAKGTNKKTSGRDMAFIERDFLLTAGFVSRVGEFRKESPQFESSPNYYVVEYWSSENNKWIMIDFLDSGYFESNNKPLSAIEVLNSDVKDLTYVGRSTQNEYRQKIKKYLNSYTIAIDNTLPSKNSNSYVTYVKDSKDVDIMINGNYISPTIFTQNKDTFTIEPGIEAPESDSKAYLILMKKPVSGKEEKPAFVAGAFQNGAVIDECYIRINNSDFEKVDRYKEFIMEKGENTIELSLDGQNVISSVKIKKNK